MHQEITNIIKNIVERAGFKVDDVEISLDQDLGLTQYSIKTDDPQLLIGRNGDVLRSVNHIVKLMFETQHADADHNFLIDVNGYHGRHIDELKTKARIVADRARSFKSDIKLDPMSSYDRLIIHSYMSNQKDIATESDGQGPERHVVVKYLG